MYVFYYVYWMMSKLFSDKLDTLQGTTPQTFVDPQALPWYFKARPVQYTSTVSS